MAHGSEYPAWVDSPQDERYGEGALEKVESRMRAIVKQTLDACSDMTDPAGDKARSFQVLGYDFLLDEDLRVWLLGTNPLLSGLFGGAFGYLGPLG